MQENRRNGQEQSDIVATSEFIFTLRKKQKLRICTLSQSYQFALIQCFIEFLFVLGSFHR